MKLAEFLFLFIICTILGRSYQYKNVFNVYYFESKPDGFKRSVLGINGQTPTPPIRVKYGETVEITLINYIKNGVTDIHFHGIFQKKTLLSDGVGEITQCDPLYGEKYIYSFKAIGQTGTFWYHSHAGLQYVDGLKGPFIIDEDHDLYLRPFNTVICEKYLNTNHCLEKVEKQLFYVDHSSIDKDRQRDAVIQLTDWFHETADVLNKFFLSPESGGDEPTPDSALINGVGNYYCQAPNCESFYDTKIVNGKAKKFRFINESAMAVFHISIDHHEMYIVEADGVTLDGKTNVKVLKINSGQRYSVIVKANQKPGNYWIRAVMDETIYPAPPSPDWNPNVFGILYYTDSKGNLFSNSRPSDSSFFAMDSLLIQSIDEGKVNIDLDVPLVPLRKLYKRPPTKCADKTFTFDINNLVGDDGVNFLGFNKILFLGIMDTTLLGKILNFQSYETPTKLNGIYQGYNTYKFKKGDVVDIIINNYDAAQHPIHGHGHNFYVMYQGNTNSKNYVSNNKNPFPYNRDATLRDTISVNGSSVLVLRFRADNPGIWVFHCHIAWHLEAGLMLTLIEDEKKIRELYSSYRDKVSVCNTY
jgi:iron transport multicopper oxidase